MITKDEWLRRYKARFTEVAEITDQEVLQNFADNVEYDELDEAALQDPEGEADVEMSYWDAE